MTTITYTVRPSFQKLANAFGKIDIKSFLRRETEKLAFSTERFGKQFTPVDTGRLRASIGVSSLIGGQIGHMVATDTEYAIYVHEGTRYMRARPFLKQGLEYAVRNLEGRVGSRLDKEITDKFKRL